MEDFTRSIATATDPDVSDNERCRAFEAVVKRFQDMAFGYAYSLLGDRHLAENRCLRWAHNHLGTFWITQYADAPLAWF